MATTQVAQQEYIEKRTVLRAGLKITVPRPQTTTRPVVRAPTTTATTPYVVKLPTACTGAKSIMASTMDRTKDTTDIPQSVKFELPPINFEPRKPRMVTHETTKTIME